MRGGETGRVYRREQEEGKIEDSGCSKCHINCFRSKLNFHMHFWSNWSNF